MLIGTVYVHTRGEVVPFLSGTMLRMVKRLAVPDVETFKRLVREQYPNRDVEVSFGPIGPPWEKD